MSRGSKARPPKPRTSPLVLGILGGIGSGKSTVARLLEERGARVVDADRIAHKLLQEKEIEAQVVKAFGSSVLAPGGGIDRERLRTVFRHEADVRRLESILHPRVLEDIHREVARHRQGGPGTCPVLVLDIPLLVEKGLQGLADVLIFVDAPREVRLERLKRRSGLDEAELARRERLQTPLDFKRDLANTRIDAGRSLDELRQQIARLWHDLVDNTGDP